MPLPEYAGYPSERIALTSGSGTKERVPYSSGLNWGQRPGRNHNQAYLAVSAHMQKSGFLPNIGVEFKIVLADDSGIWRCARRQANGKAIHTIDDNSIVGLYFRRKLDLDPGDLITITHLLKYGRTSIDLYRESMHTYILDFQHY